MSNSKYLDQIYATRKKRIVELMTNKKIRSYRRIDLKCGFANAKMASLMREGNNISERYARTIEEHYGLNSLWLDHYEQNIVENKGYILESYTLKKQVFAIKNIDVPDDYFYIEVTNDSIFKKGTLILFKPLLDIMKVESNNIYLIRVDNDYHIVKSQDYVLESVDKTFDINDVTIVAEKFKIEL